MRKVPFETTVLVIGAGPAGLSTAASLRARDIDALVVERDRALGERWRRRYEGLRLNTVRWMSSMPGMAIPRAAGAWPSAEAFAEYLERYARHHALDVRHGVEVERVDRTDGGYVVRTSAGDVRARSVVVASGCDNVAWMPAWPGVFTGTLLHSSEYRSAADHAGKDVLVVGLGNSGAEIAAQLVAAGAANVSVSVRTPPTVLARRILGVPASFFGRLSLASPRRMTDAIGYAMQRIAWGDLRRYGLPRAPRGIATERALSGHGPVIGDGFVQALKAGAVTLVPAVDGFDGDEVVLADGRRLRPDVVIAATGYRSGLEAMLGHLGVLLPNGRPMYWGGKTHPDAPGLYFNGYWYPLAGPLWGMRRSARRIARAIAAASKGARTDAPRDALSATG